MTGESVVQKEVLVRLPDGLHLRPISLIARTAARFPCQITISHGERSADATSTLDLMTLEADHGARLLLQARGEQAAEALEALVPLLEKESLEETADG